MQPKALPRIQIAFEMESTVFRRGIGIAAFRSKGILSWYCSSARHTFSRRAIARNVAACRCNLVETSTELMKVLESKLTTLLQS